MKYLYLLDMVKTKWLRHWVYQEFTKRFIRSYENTNTPFIVINDAGLFSDGNFLKRYKMLNIKQFICVRRRNRISDLINQLDQLGDLSTVDNLIVICLSEIQPDYLAKIFMANGCLSFVIVKTIGNIITTDKVWCEQFDFVTHYQFRVNNQ